MRFTLSLLLAAQLERGARATEPPADEPRAVATLTSDGQYDLIVTPEVAWLSAEVTVEGAGATDVGPAEAGLPVEIKGWTTALGTLTIQIMAVAPDGNGLTWMFDVEPELVPVPQPDMSGRATKKHPSWWPF